MDGNNLLVKYPVGKNAVIDCTPRSAACIYPGLLCKTNCCCSGFEAPPFRYLIELGNQVFSHSKREFTMSDAQGITTLSCPYGTAAWISTITERGATLDTTTEDVWLYFFAAGSYRRYLGLSLGNREKSGGWVERLTWIMKECGRVGCLANNFFGVARISSQCATTFSVARKRRKARSREEIGGDTPSEKYRIFSITSHPKSRVAKPARSLRSDAQASRWPSYLQLYL